MTTAPTPHFSGVPEQLEDEKEHRRRFARAINGLVQGKANVTVDVTLNPNATTTILKDSRISFYTAVAPASALTANGAAAIVAGIWISSQLAATGTTPGQCTINHANNAATDQTIRFTLHG